MVIYRFEDDRVVVDLMFKVSWRTRLRSRLGVDRLRVIRCWSTHLSGIFTFPLITGFNEVFLSEKKYERVFKTISSKPINCTRNTIFKDIN